MQILVLDVAEVDVAGRCIVAAVGIEHDIIAEVVGPCCRNGEAIDVVRLGRTGEALVVVGSRHVAIGISQLYAGDGKTVIAGSIHELRGEEAAASGKADGLRHHLYPVGRIAKLVDAGRNKGWSTPRRGVPCVGARAANSEQRGQGRGRAAALWQDVGFGVTVEDQLRSDYFATPRDAAIAVPRAADGICLRVAEVSDEVVACGRDVECIDVSRLRPSRIAFMVVVSHDVPIEVDDVNASDVEAMVAAGILEGDGLLAALQEAKIALRTADGACSQAKTEDSLRRL